MAMVKKRNIIIETPEKIKFSYHIAEIGTRIAAYFIDEIIQLLILGFILLILIIFGISMQAFGEEKLTLFGGAFFLIMVFLFRWFYFVLFEVIMEGQSPGKKATRIRVIRSNGDSLDLETIVLRNFIRAVDGFPILPFVGGFVAFIDSQNRRLGDIIAGTIVVNEIQYNLVIPDFEVRFSRRPAMEVAGYVAAKQRLTENELYIIRRFLNEYYRLPAAKQIQVAADLAGQVRTKLGIDEPVIDPLLFLERIYKQHGV
jgi:uncharacterized RDD family membrane protein YckC